MTSNHSSPQVKSPREAETFSQRIVVGFDALGENSDSLTKALAFAILIPRSRVEVVWVPPTAYVPGGPHANKAPSEILFARVHQVLDEFGPTPLLEAEVEVRAIVGEGRPAQAISRIAFMNDADLIIVGPHENASSLGDFLLGSVTKRLVEDAPCPVLVMRPRAAGAVPEIEEPRENVAERRIGLPHRYHSVGRNVRSQENMPLLFPMGER